MRNCFGATFCRSLSVVIMNTHRYYQFFLCLMRSGVYATYCSSPCTIIMMIPWFRAVMTLRQAQCQWSKFCSSPCTIILTIIEVVRLLCWYSQSSAVSCTCISQTRLYPHSSSLAHTRKCSSNHHLATLYCCPYPYSHYVLQALLADKRQDGKAQLMVHSRDMTRGRAQ